MDKDRNFDHLERAMSQGGFTAQTEDQTWKEKGYFFL